MQVFADQVYAGIDFGGSLTLIRPSEQMLRREIDVAQLLAEEQQLQQTLFTELLLVEQVQVEKRNAILDEQHDFVISIRTGQNPQVTGLQARESLAAAERILQRIHERQTSDRRTPLTQGPHWDLAPQGVAPRIRKAG